MGSVEFSIDDVVEQLLPVWLSSYFDLQAFCFEESFLLRDNNRGTVG
jgi:hypothetical protein